MAKDAEEKLKEATMAFGNMQGAQVIYPKKKIPTDPKLIQARKIYAEGMNNVIFRRARNKFRILEDRHGTGALDSKEYIMKFIMEQL